MAVTAIWNVKGNIGKALIYIENPDKTIHIDNLNSSQLSESDRESLKNVIGYVKRDKSDADNTEAVQFISGINVSTEETLMEMMATKKLYGKTGGNTAYHAYQSFAPGETSPEIAHDIGRALAKELWGEKFQVIVATHIDKLHVHNHFILNSVSFRDGSKYNDCKKTYRTLREASDRLCREYNLSVIENPKGKSMNYSEWNDERIGKQTWKSIIKEDVDKALSESMTDREFFMKLKSQGYEIKHGKDISVKPPGKERFVRLARNFGDEYSIEGIRQRILSQLEPTFTNTKSKANIVIQKTSRLNSPPERRIKGYHGIYFRYYYNLTSNHQRSKGRNARMHFLLREDLNKLDNIYSEMTLLRENKIETKEQLISYQESTSTKINALLKERQNLRNKMRCVDEGGNVDDIKSEITTISSKLKLLRRNIKQCDSILIRSGVINEKMDIIKQEQINKDKEVHEHGQFRRSR